jgi:hypothetical protein
MWACLQDQDTAGHWKQVAGWRKVCDLAQTHLGRLKEYRRGLAEAWPPETNAAARRYLAELDQLVDTVQRTHDAAAANYDALAAAARAIGSTRADLEPIYQEYADKLQQKRAYEATVADPKAVAGSRLPDRPPVTAEDLEGLNVRARGLMTGLSGELQQAQVMLQRPPTPAKLPRQTDDPDVYGGGAPSIPPIVPVPVATTDQKPIKKPQSVTSPVPTGATGVGPVLGGASTGLVQPPSTPGLLGNSPTPHLASPPTPGMPAHLPSLPGPLGRLGPPSEQPGSARRILPGNPEQFPRPIPSKPMPPGGLIGEGHGFGAGQPIPGSSPRRANPVGGVIGGGGAGTSPSGGAGSRPGGGRIGQFGSGHGMAPMGGSPGLAGGPGGGPVSGRPGRRDPTDREPRQWDPDNPWETDEGVPPVVRPPDDDGPIDPGPAIGFSR